MSMKELKPITRSEQAGGKKSPMSRERPASPHAGLAGGPQLLCVSSDYTEVLRLLLATFLKNLRFQQLGQQLHKARTWVGQSPAASSFGSPGTPHTPPLVSCHRGQEELTQSKF